MVVVSRQSRAQPACRIQQWRCTAAAAGDLKSCSGIFSRTSDAQSYTSIIVQITATLSHLGLLQAVISALPPQ